VSGKVVRVTPKEPGEPALLRVCNGIRKETCSVYYAENDFDLDVVDFDGAAIVDFGWQHFNQPYPPKNNIAFLMDGVPNWDNLVRWIKATQYGPCLRPDISGSTFRSDYILGGAF